MEPICQGMVRVSRATHDELLLEAATRGVESHEQQAPELCDCYMPKDIAGVFFARLEHIRDNRNINGKSWILSKKPASPSSS